MVEFLPEYRSTCQGTISSPSTGRFYVRRTSTALPPRNFEDETNLDCHLNVDCQRVDGLTVFARHHEQEYAPCLAGPPRLF